MVLAIMTLLMDQNNFVPKRGNGGNQFFSSAGQSGQLERDLNTYHLQTRGGKKEGDD